MSKKNEIQWLVSRYQSDIVALEERKEDLLTHINVLKNLMPTPEMWNMSILDQKGMTVDPKGDKANAKEQYTKLEGILGELQQTVNLIIGEEKLIKQRIEVLEKSSKELEDPHRNLFREPDDMFGKGLSDVQVDARETKGITSKKGEEQELKGKNVNSQDSTDWKNLCESLVKQAGNLDENLKTSTKKLKESETHAKELEKEYFNLKRELQIKNGLWQGVSESAFSAIIEKDETKVWEKHKKNDSKTQSQNKAYQSNKADKTPEAVSTPPTKVADEEETARGSTAVTLTAEMPSKTKSVTIDPSAISLTAERLSKKKSVTKLPSAISLTGERPSKKKSVTIHPSAISLKAESTVKTKALTKSSGSEEVESQPSPPKEGGTDWKRKCENVLKQLNELSANIKNIFHHLKENEKQAKYLEEECQKLEREIHCRIETL